MEKSTEVRRVLEDYSLPVPPEEPLKKEQFHVNELSWKGYDANALRPVPSFLPIES